jgi:hypothetical protein
MALGGMCTVRTPAPDFGTQERDRFIAHALEALSQPVAQGPDRPLVTAEDGGDRARSRTHRARRPTNEDDAIQETNPDQDVSDPRVRPSERVRPSGFEPETCGIERSDSVDEEDSVKGQFRYPLV